MLALVAASVCFAGFRPAVSLIEAVAASEWFCRCVDLKPPFRVASVRLDEYGWGRTYGTPIYVVGIDRTGNRTLSIGVDATSGDVVFADIFPAPGAAACLTRQTDVWLRRLGRANELTADPAMNRYDVVLGGHRILNPNGYNFTMFQVRDSECVWFDSYGEPPPPPSGEPSVKRAQAIQVAQAERKKTVPKWPLPLEDRPSLGLFYDEKEKVTKWVWAVDEGSALNGRFNMCFTGYVDARTGKAISSNWIGTSRWMYHSRSPREGLALVKPLTVDIPLYTAALHKLAELGQSGVHFDSFEGKEGLHLTGDNLTKMELGPSGKLVSFQSYAPFVRLGQKDLARGRAIILAEHPTLPEGRFLIDSTPFGSTYDVVYRQTALGYEYLGSRVVTVGIGANGRVFQFSASEPASRPSGVPAKLMSPSQVESLALAMAKPYLEKSTPNVRYYATAKAERRGWFVPQGSKSPRLSYLVEVWFMRDIKNWAVQGGGSWYHFDAESGACLDKFPGWVSPPHSTPRGRR